MLFDVYGDNAVYQWIGWIIVFLALIGFNEIARRTKIGGITCFLVFQEFLTALLHRDLRGSRPRVPSGRSTTPRIST